MINITEKNAKMYCINQKLFIFAASIYRIKPKFLIQKALKTSTNNDIVALRSLSGVVLFQDGLLNCRLGGKRKFSTIFFEF